MPAVGLQDVMLDETEEARLLGDIPDDMTQLEPGMFPLVITFRKFLTMLDGSLARPFFPKQGKDGIDSGSNKAVFEQLSVAE